MWGWMRSHRQSVEMRRGMEREEIEASRVEVIRIREDTTIGVEMEGTLDQIEFFKSGNKKSQIRLPTYPPSRPFNSWR